MCGDGSPKVSHSPLTCARRQWRLVLGECFEPGELKEGLQRWHRRRGLGPPLRAVGGPEGSGASGFAFLVLLFGQSQ